MTAGAPLPGRAAALPRVAAACLLPLVGGCAPGLVIQETTPEPSPAQTAVEGTGKGWWRVSFHLAWEQSEEPDWHLDALLADQILAPVIVHAEPRISLWRFHRRAAADSAGHRFSFLFYADAETAALVNHGVESAPLTGRLQEAGLVQRLSLAAVDNPAPADVGAASDSGWPPAVMRGWPWFIMGVSQSWLRLIAEVKAQRPPPVPASLDDVLDYYRSIHVEVSTLWREHGQHAYLHHLNAVFGYQLLIIQETNLKRF